MAQPAGLMYPREGVVCDSVGQTCYDSYGPSIGITTDVYGKKAGNHLSKQLGNSNSRDFRLSTGQACSVARRTCWNDGWSQSRVAPGLTQQLFGGGSGGNLRPGQAQVARDTGLCSLSRGSQRVYDGPCLLKQVRQGGQNRYEVQLQNGNNYVFQQLGGRFEIRDGFGGTWPVTFIDHG
ncbi:MAG: YcgJ family protein, partial [Vulcanococcus sp.]